MKQTINKECTGRMNVKMKQELERGYKIKEQIEAISDNIGETNMLTDDVKQQIRVHAVDINN